MDHRTTEAAARLRERGLRVTAPRVAVLEVLAGHPHATADTVAGLVRARLGSVSMQAVYDVLGACDEVGLVRRIEPAGSPARFETRTGDNHHHLVCRRCGATVEVEGPTVERWTSAIAGEHGYTEVSHTLEIFGTCPRC